MQFVFDAMRPDGTMLTDRLDAPSQAEVAESLRAKGLIILRLQEGGKGKHPAGAATGTPARSWHGSRVTTRDLILFTRQMKMLLEAGAPLVPALEAAEEQTTKPAMRGILHRLRERVEQGENLSRALQSEGGCFDPVFRSMIAAGEATASLPQVFARLCGLAQQQQQTRKLVVGALLYPLILCILLSGVIAVLLFFVVPRFKILFTSLKSPLPTTTFMLFEASNFLLSDWPYLVGGLAAAVAGAVVCLRLPAARRWLDEAVLHLPVFGALTSRLIFARVVRVWAAMLRCHVPLLETIRQSRDAITNTAYLRLLTSVEETVSRGGRMGEAITAARLADPVIVSAIRVGEDNGRLAEATDFVSDWMDEDNTQLVQQATRLAEPILLAVMGVIVGFVATCLFLPLFDLASAAG